MGENTQNYLVNQKDWLIGIAVRHLAGMCLTGFIQRITDTCTKHQKVSISANTVPCTHTSFQYGS